MTTPEPDDTAGTADAVKAPGLAALLRRNPRLKRHAAVGAIVAGVAVFVIASVNTPLAGADPDGQHGVDAARTGNVDLGALLPLATDTTAPPTTGDKVLTSKPVHVKKPAPATKAVINSLAANGIPNIALNAYRVAAARIDNVDPSCGLDWALLAGIGRVESDHGQVGGAVLDSNGTTTPPIIGPALDGKHWDYIPAPANGEQLDGDAVYAHALGPMQFIPQTWAVYGADANGDGVADVFNINDAALGAARYLCAAGGDLRTVAGQKRAVLTYNHSDEYLAQVLALADAYRRGIAVTGIPLVGNTKGTLSPVRTKHVPPANPGSPATVGHGSKTTTGKTKSGTGSATKSPGSSVTTPAAGGTGTVSPGSSTAPAPSGSRTPSPTPQPTSGSPGSPTPAPPASSSPTPSPTPTKKCVIPDPFDSTKCWL